MFKRMVALLRSKYTFEKYPLCALYFNLPTHWAGVTKILLRIFCQRLENSNPCWKVSKFSDSDKPSTSSKITFCVILSSIINSVRCYSSCYCCWSSSCTLFEYNSSRFTYKMTKNSLN